MSKVDASHGIIYNLLATDHDALTKVAETIQSMVTESDRSAGRLAKMVHQTQRTKARIADASAHLEQRLNSGAELLRELQEQTARLEAAEAGADARKRESQEATARLGQRLAELTAKRRQLEEARAEVEAEIRAKSELLASKESLKAQLAELTAKCQRLEKGQAEAEAEIRAKSELLASKESVEAQLAKLTAKCQRLEKAQAEAEAEIRAKSELLASKESLEAQLGELTAKCQRLEKAQAEAEAEMRGKSRALEVISRDLHGPLEGMIDLVERLQETKLDTQQRRQLRVTQLSLAAMMHLLESVLVPQKLLRTPTKADNRRAQGRLPQELLRSNLGPVLDLSMGGMRVRCTRARKGDVDVELMELEEPVKLRAEVMWTRRQGLRRYEVGLKFLDVPPDVDKQLTEVALNHSLRRLLSTR